MEPSLAVRVLRSCFTYATPATHWLSVGVFLGLTALLHVFSGLCVAADSSEPSKTGDVEDVTEAKEKTDIEVAAPLDGPSPSVLRVIRLFPSPLSHVCVNLPCVLMCMSPDVSQT